MRPRRRPLGSRREHRRSRSAPAARPVAVRLTPASLYFYAADFLRSAKKSSTKGKPLRPAQYYLVCHALELGFEAYLALAGEIVDDSVRSPFERNLVRLLAKADQLGLRDFVPLDLAATSEIRKASLYYAEAVFEFPALAEAMRGYPQRPRLDVLLDVTQELLSVVRLALSRGRLGSP